MSEYRTTATLTSEGTFVVPGPKDLPEGTRVEVTVRYSDVPTSGVQDPIKEFYERLKCEEPRPSVWEHEQIAVRELRGEWA